ncbi:MAG: rhodanese-like domain-containing protein [Candidatus Gracilibacteria bacterium]|jgi:rhodanese-related sulfurtransferase
MKSYFLIIFSAIFLVNSVKTAQAVPPPDFLFNVGAQIVQAFSIIVIFLSAALVSFRQFAGVFYQSIQHKKIFWVSMALVVVGISLGSAYFYGQYKQNDEYQKWITQSKTQNQNFEITDYSIDKLKVGRPTGNGTVAELPQTIADQAGTSAKDPNEAFIRKYYEDIGNGNLEEAYAISKKQVSLEVFKGWYSGVTSARIDEIQNIDSQNYSVNLVLVEGGTATSYGVLMTLKTDNLGNISIADSKVRVLGTVASSSIGVASSSPATAATSQTPQPARPITQIENSQVDENFFINNKDLPLAVTNEEFQQEIDSGNSLFVLDAREDEEYEIGYFQGSTHIRFADLIAGQWINLPTDEVIYVFCWSGMRGEEVAKFLRTKNIVSRYIKTGADGWVTFGGDWTGGIKFLSKYTAERYRRLFSYDELKDQIAEGVAIVDSRVTNKYEAWHIPGSINIPIIYTPTSDISGIMSEVPEGAKVITVCDDFISCFDAKITGVKLEKLGHEFLGRYNNPWEYRNNE